jgi:hypothetical protein
MSSFHLIVFTFFLQFTRLFISFLLIHSILFVNFDQFDLFLVVSFTAKSSICQSSSEVNGRLSF